MASLLLLRFQPNGYKKEGVLLMQLRTSASISSITFLLSNYITFTQPISSIAYLSFIIMDPIAHPLSAMSAKSKGSSSTATKKQQPTIPLYGNDGFGCKSTHARKSDSRRHNTSVSVSGKKPCPFDRCGYATGGVDKMNEHMRKMHDVPRKYTYCFHTSLQNNANHYSVSNC